MRPVSSSDIVISADDRIASSSQEAPRRRKDKGTGRSLSERPAIADDRLPLSAAVDPFGRHDERDERTMRNSGDDAMPRRPRDARRNEPTERPWSRWLPKRRPAPQVMPSRSASRTEPSDHASRQDPVVTAGAEPVLHAERAFHPDPTAHFVEPQTTHAPRARRSRRDAEFDAEFDAPPPVKSRRKRILTRWTKSLSLSITPLQKLALGGVALTALLVSGAVVWHSGYLQRTTRQAMDNSLGTSAKAGFRLEDITVMGRGRTSMDDIAMALQANHGSPILSLDLEEVKDRLEAIPSIQFAAVERRLPSGLHISIVERIPMAVWQHNGQHILVDKSGHMIPGPITGYEDLPLVVGDGAATKAAELLEMLKTEPDMAKRVKASVRVANRRWNIRLDDAYHGLEVRLPEDQTEAAWHRLARLEREQALTQRRLSMIDLRAPDRLILKADRPAGVDDSVKPKDNGA